MSRKRLLQGIKDDSGVAVLIIAAVITVVAFTALSIFLNKFIGGRDLARAQLGAASQSRALPALYSYYMAKNGTSAPLKLPCPDTALSPSGTTSASTCADPTKNYIGVLPWRDLGLAQSDVQDSYGRYYTYVVSGAANGLCESITKDFATSDGAGGSVTKEFTGNTLAARLEVLVTSQTAGQGRKVPFAIIGHGANASGALTAAGAFTSASSASTPEQANAASTDGSSYRTLSVPTSTDATQIYSGPMSLDSSSTATAPYFDDQVLVPSTAAIQKICAQETPGGKINASLSDGFNNDTTTANNFGNIGASNAPTITTSSHDPTNKVASFGTTGGGVTTFLVSNAANFNFAPLARPVYLSSTWRAPSTGATFSIATRGTSADINPGTDDFSLNGTNGITFRFGGTLTIRNNAVQVAGLQTSASSGFTGLVANTLYTLEVYDNGSDVWMRITEQDNPTVYATAYATGVTGDTGGDQRVYFINGAVASELDDVLAGYPMLALETTGTNSYAAVSSSGSNGVATGTLTLEAWIRPRAFTTNAAIIATWDTAHDPTSSSDPGDPADQGYRLRLNSTGQVIFDASVIDGSAAFAHFTGPGVTVGQWTHIAVTYDTNSVTDPLSHITTFYQTVAFYQDGDLYSTVTATPAHTIPLNSTAAAGTPKFAVGADAASTVLGADGFTGDISDVRVWNTARTAQNIHDYAFARLSADDNASPTGLVVNWRLDAESGGVGGTLAKRSPPSTGTEGTLTAASYVPSLATYLRPISTTFCPQGTIAGAYECDFRSPTYSTNASGQSAITIPSALTSIFVKAWGAGGGGYDDATSNSNDGGGAGHTAGRITSIGGVELSDMQLDVYVGTKGAGSYSTQYSGGGGGGASAVVQHGAGSSIVAGGGGGGSYSAFYDPSLGLVGLLLSGLLGDISPFTQFGSGGQGGGGGGYDYDSSGNAKTVEASDSIASQHCGGQGGDNTPTNAPPPTSKICPSGGNLTFTVASINGGDGGNHNGGSSSAGSGGGGYDGTTTTTIGGGGGGGGVSGGQEGGYGSYSFLGIPYHNGGFGGGGGSGTATTGTSSQFGARGNGSYSNTSLTGSTHSGKTQIDSISASIVSVWKVGMSISGGTIPAGSTIVSIDSSTSVTISAATTATASAVSLTVTTTAGSAGNYSDYFYSPPNYISRTYPGKGGTAGGTSSVNGTDGAVILLW